MDDLHDDLTTHVADELTPLSEERLAEIRTIRNGVSVTPRFAIDDLLAEVKRQRETLDAARRLWLADRERWEKREAALLAVVRAVAEASIYRDAKGEMLITDYPNKLREQARAALAAAEAGERA